MPRERKVQVYCFTTCSMTGGVFSLRLQCINRDLANWYVLDIVLICMTNIPQGTIILGDTVSRIAVVGIPLKKLIPSGSQIYFHTKSRNYSPSACSWWPNPSVATSVRRLQKSY
jgi:hypothetical protein